MDGDDLSESEPSEPKTLAEIFKEAFPYYLAMGMTYDEYWRDDPTLVRDYRKAKEIENRNEEWARWRQGLYIYDALIKVAPIIRPFTKGEIKPGEYPDRPYPLTEKEAREQEQQKEREKVFAFMKKLEAESERNLKKLEAAKRQEV